MPKWISAAFALFLSLQVFSTRGETVDDVINHFVKVMGGSDRLNSVKTIYSEAIQEEENGKKIYIRAHKVPDNYLGTLVDYIPKGHVAELTGKQTINGISCYSVRLTLKSGMVVNYFIDAENWYIIREVRTGDGLTSRSSEMTIDYSDYRKTPDGLLFPFKVLIGPFPEKRLNYQKIEVNKPVNYPLNNPDSK